MVTVGGIMIKGIIKLKLDIGVATCLHILEDVR